MGDILKSTEDHVRSLLAEQMPKKYKYHRLSHTEEVVNECRKIASASPLNNGELEMLMLAAWFHDTGYINGHQEHEAGSEAIAREFLGKHKYDKDKIEKVRQCIRETKLPQKPESTIGKILCDADMSGLGSADYRKKSKKLRKEKEKLDGKKYSDREWIDSEIDFLTGHSYFTPAAQKLYDTQKQVNITALKAMQNEMVQAPEELMAQDDVQQTEKKKKEKRRYSRGVETMFRAGARTHINLSSMADSKANIMLSINAVIISVTLSVLLPKLDSHAHLVMPTVILLATCLLSIIFATLSTKPKVTKGRFSKEDIMQKRSNLLFFGNFHKMDLKEFEWGMEEMMKDDNFLYGSMSRDLYFLGKVLAEKYRYLRICYTLFMYGLIASVIAFGIALATFNPL